MEIFSTITWLVWHFKSLILIFGALIAVAYLNYNSNFLNQTKYVIEASVNPFYRLFNRASQVFYGVGEGVTNHFNTQEKLKQLHSKEFKIQQLEAQIESLQFENHHLKQALNLINDYNPNARLVKVLRKSPFEHGGFIIINAGEKDNVKIGDITTYNGYLLGLVQEVYYNSAKVITIFNKDFAIPAYTENSQKSLILQGDNNGYMKIKFQEIKENNFIDGELIITSGEGNSIPPNIIIGNISLLPNRHISIKPKSEYHLLDFVTLISENG